MTGMTQPPDAPAPAVPPGALEYAVFYNPAAAFERWTAAKRLRTSRIISLGLSVAIVAALWWFWRDELGGWSWWLLGLSFLWPLSSLGRALWSVRAARTDLARVHEGVALGVGRGGLLLDGAWIPWPEVGALRALPGRRGRAGTLVVETRDGRRVDVLLDYLSQKPGTVDSAVRALSGGRWRIDLTPLDP